MEFEIYENFVQKKASERKVQKLIRYISSYRLSSGDIIGNDREFFIFCKKCDRIESFQFLGKIYDIPCLCDDARDREQQIMRKRIAKHKKESKYEVQRLF